MPGKGKTTNSPKATGVPAGPFGNQPKTAYGRLTTDDKKFLTEAEVVERYRGVISPGTLRNWRHQKIGPPFQKCGRGVLYPAAGLDQWDRENTVTCRPAKVSKTTEEA